MSKYKLQNKKISIADTTFSNRELDCLGLWLLGISPSIGAKALHVAPSTIQTYRQRALAKLGTCSKKIIIKLLRKHGALQMVLSRAVDLALLAAV